MKKILLFVTMVAVMLATFGCKTIDRKAVQRPIMPGSSVGISVYPADPFFEYELYRKLMTAGYKVKAINTVQAQALYPGLHKLFNSKMKLKGSIEKLHDMSTMSNLQQEIALRKELGKVKEAVGMDYLLYFYMKGTSFNAVGIDLGSYEIIYSHSFEPGSFHFGLFPSKEDIVDKIIDLFLNALQNK